MYLKRNNELEVLRLYTQDYKSQFYLREISRTIKFPLKNVQNILSSLEKAGILKSSLRGKNKYFYLNLDKVQTKLILLQTEIYKTLLFLEKYPLFKTFLKKVTTQTPIIVFGSFAKFTADKDSDLDLILIQKKQEKLPGHLLPYKVHAIILSEESFRKALEKQETLIKEVETNHLILNNHSFYVNVIWNYYEP